MLSLDIYNYSVAAQDRVNLLKECMEEMEAGANPKSLQTRSGLSWQSLYRLFAAWKKSNGDRSVLMDRRYYRELWKTEESAAKLPEEFLTWVAGQMLGNQRKSRPAWRGIIRRWLRWLNGDQSARIPGYETCPLCGTSGKHPSGWSYTNLMDKAQPPKAELVLARVGTAAAREFLPCVHGTRKGARWLEWVFFDDVWLDRKCIVPGYPQPARILQLGGLDYATGYYLKFGQRPELPNDDGTRDRLKKRDFLFLVAALIDEYGFPEQYKMHFVLERGTATLSRAEAQVLYDASDGRIVCGYTSMDGQFMLAWEEGKIGNFRGKSPLESWHALLHNESASIGGQVGKDRNHCPQLIEGMEREAVTLYRAGLVMTEEQRMQLRFPYPTLSEAYAQTLDVVARINARADHECEGFDQVAIWKLPGVPMLWQPASTLPEGMEDKVEWSSRVETPAERKSRLSVGVRMLRLPPGIWPRFYDDGHEVCTVNQRSEIEVRVDGRKVFFGPADPAAALPAGSEVLAYFFPNDPQLVHITHKGKYVAAWPRLQVRRGDRDGLSAAIRRNQTFLNETTARVTSKMAEKLSDEQRRTDDNSRLVAAAFGVRTGDQVTETSGASALQAISERIASDRKDSRIMDREARREGLAAAEEFLSAPAATTAEAPSQSDQEEFLDSIL
jgi:hypothetical protein